MYLSLLLSVLSLCSLTVAPNRVYHFFEGEKNWTAAQRFCKEHYTDLVTVHNLTEMKSICTNQNGCENAWIGLYNLNISSRKLWRWSQPEQVYNEEETNWATSPQPTESLNCVCTQKNLTDGKLYWNTKGCYSSIPFLCYNGTTDKYIKISDAKTWLQAQNYCRDHHTDLVSGIHQLSDTDLVSVIASDTEFFWIGLFRDVWAWSDESNSSFRNWEDTGRGNNNTFVSQNNQCAKLGQNNQWYNVECSEKHPFICYDDEMVLVKENKTFEEALIYCRTHYGDLAMMRDDHEQRLAQNKVNMADTQFVWVGLHFACFFEEWIWVNGHWVSSNDKNWENRKKPSKCGVSGAMQKGSSRKWFKENIGERYNFVCAVHYVSPWQQCNTD